ncbi:hypothetical protein NHX12_027410 [Muraenolepis orangiensis]|uniref:Uncharacterized protein n=1 Tax=Muraenolepis orangiensis TaxID=630683 RepID=A0A9Q0EFG4_9TELE|nr:hypothetical protein NHX12_027410 [Muraenolepis orangiensis]
MNSRLRCVHRAPLLSRVSRAYEYGKDPLQRLDRILNETRQRAVLRASVESPSLGGKIQRLQQTGQEQRGRLALFEDDLRDAGQERDRTSPSPWFMMQTHF